MKDKLTKTNKKGRHIFMKKLCVALTIIFFGSLSVVVPVTMLMYKNNNFAISTNVETQKNTIESNNNVINLKIN